VEHLQQNIHVIVRPGDEQGYFAECLEISVVTQGATLDEVAQNLMEAVSLHLEDEDPSEFGLVPHLCLAVSFELQHRNLELRWQTEGRKGISGFGAVNLKVTSSLNRTVKRLHFRY
jgi:predicted RNase H-like HicB family nuclease